MGTVIFSHGQESGPNATKITAMRQVTERIGWQSRSLDYRGIESAKERADKLLQTIESLSAASGDNLPLILVGSSMGAYVSLLAAKGRNDICGLFLLAPAVYLPGYEVDELGKVTSPMQIIHGWHDEIVPVDNVIRFARNHSAQLMLVDDRHRLVGVIPLIERQLEGFLLEWAAINPEGI